MLPSKKKSCVRAGRAVKCNACGQKKKCLYLTGELSEDIPAACLTPIEANKENFPPTVAPPRKKKRKTDAHDHDADKLIELLQKKNDLLLQAIQTKQEDFALLLKEQEATKKLLVKTIREKVELSQELDAIKYPNKFRVNGDFGKPQEGDSGYPQGGDSSTFQRHSAIIKQCISAVAGCDGLKERQLIQHLGRQVETPQELQEKEAAKTIMQNVCKYFEKLNSTSEGRFDSATSSARYLLCAAACHSVRKGLTPFLSKIFGVSIDFIAKSRQRWIKLCVGEVGSLLDLPFTPKKDAIPAEYDQVCQRVWHEATRPSEKAKDSVRDPSNKGARHRIHWQEMRLHDIYKRVNEEGRGMYGEQWRYNIKRCAAQKPFYIRPAGRAECLCVYCLEFDLYIKAYYQYVRSLRVIGCECEIIVPKNAHDFRAAFICPKPEGSNFYSKACINNTCDTCKDWNKVPQCTCRQHFPTIKYEKRTNIVVKNKFGQDVTKKDFVRTVSTFEEFWQDFVGYRSKYLLHHTKHIHQTAEFRYKISNLQRGEVLVVEDFSENGKLVRKFAQQDTHWAEHGYTLYPIVMLIRVEDLKDSFFTGGAAEKATLLEHFHQENKLPAILVNLTYLSDDVIHDNAMVQHAHGLAVEKLKEITLATPTGQSVIKTAHIFSDGGPSHYKLKDHVFFISKHYELFGMVCNWNYMCSGHGKNWSDPFGGWAKAVLNRVQLEAEDGQTASITTVAEAVEYLRDNYSRPTKRTQQKKGLSVYCNIYEYIPASGPGSVSRRHPKVADFPGVRKLHQILGARLPGRVHVREATCISCQECRGGRFTQCVRSDVCGQLQMRDVTTQVDPTNRLTRGRAEELAHNMIASIKKGTIFACSPGGDVTAPYHLYLATEDGQLQGQRLNKLVAHSNLHEVIDPTVVQVITPVVKIDVEMDRIEKRYATRRQNQATYRLTGEQQQAILVAVEALSF